MHFKEIGQRNAATAILYLEKADLAKKSSSPPEVKQLQLASQISVTTSLDSA
jgi:hypothetical protein